MALRKLIEDRRAAVALIFGISVVPVITLIGSSIDYMQALRARTHLQAAADSAALAAVALEGVDAGTRITLAHNAFNANFPSGAYGLAPQPTVTVDGGTVTVDAGAGVPTSFLGLVGVDSVAIGVTATALRLDGKPACVLALNPNSAGAVHLHGTPTLTAIDCAVHSNSNSNAALRTEGAALAVAADFCAVGGHSGSGFVPPPHDKCPKVKDPLEGLPVPADLSCDPDKKNEFKMGLHTVTEGVFCGGIDVKAHANVLFTGGVYVIRDGPLTLHAHSTIIGSDVTFYFYGENTGLSILSHSVVDITAPKTGPYAGVAFAQHPDSNPGHINSIEGGGGTRIVGTAYFPTQVLDIGGAGAFGATSPYMGLVADRIVVRGNAQLVVQTDHAAAGFGPLLPNILGAVRLVN